MPYLVGSFLALAAFELARTSGLARTRAFYPAVLAVVASLYLFFAATIGSGQLVATELLLAVPFLLALILGYRLGLWWVVAGLAGHGLLDAVHGGVVSNPGVPTWWPAFCGAYDITAAIGLGVWLTMTRARDTGAGASV